MSRVKKTSKKAKGARPNQGPEVVPHGEAQRQGGQWKGRVRIAEDFDELPEDIARAFGMETARRRSTR
jgi:hypothetical protein